MGHLDGSRDTGFGRPAPARLGYDY